MKAIRRISLLLTIIMVFSSIPVFAVTADDVKREGDVRGYEDGRIVAEAFNDAKEFYDYSNSKVPKPNRETVFSENNDYLKDKYSYRDTFYIAYIGGYKRGYTDYIRRQGSNIPGSPSESGGDIVTNLGGVFGLIYGEIAGLKDFQEGKTLNWSRVIPKDGAINSTYDLGNLPSTYRIMFIREFKDEFQKGYEKAYLEAQFHLKRDNSDSGRGDGETFGATLGNAYGAKDFYDGRISNYKKDMPTDSKIIADYLLATESQDYLNGFVNGFKEAYRDSYIKSFSEAKNFAISTDDKEGYENGYSAGNLRGGYQAEIDYLMGDDTKTIPLGSEVTKEYNLSYQSKAYRDGFLGGFFTGYTVGYQNIYNNLRQGDARQHTSSYSVPISGGIFVSYDRHMSLEVDSGIFFNPTIVNMSIVNTNYAVDKRYITATDFYRINLVNPSGEYNKDKRIEISFEYYGDNDGGIYVLKDNKWQYLKSRVENGKIATSISPVLLKDMGSVFVVFVDKNKDVFHDIRGHWAKEEIEVFNRRNIIYGYGDNTFKPEQNITRAEFLVLLSRVYNWNLPNDVSNLGHFKDRAAISKDYEKAISYGLSSGYVMGYGDGSYKPNNNISYNEVDIIMRRVLGDNSFSWKSFAEYLKYSKKVPSSSLDSIDNKITRAEFSYLLYELTKWDF
ncbi:MAG: S-layer homology domain-containing protein [Tissierellaceae bacterium]|nr:S-layer homology domain-containing protein [Tissierellaceae bacterium]